MDDRTWQDVGAVDELRQTPVRQVRVGRKRIALTCKGGEFGAISGACNHAGGPLGEGCLDGDYVVCPWHNWKYHRATGEGEPGFEADAVPRHEVRITDGRVFVSEEPITRRSRAPHPPHPLERSLDREPGPVRVLGLSTTVMDASRPRPSTSEFLLDIALEHAEGLGCPTRRICLRDLSFRACEGYYSKSAQACTWPCSITQMDPTDQLDQVYEGIIFWSDVVLIATPIRWGAASSLYFKMAERMNCVQNQITIRDRVMIRNKVASFIITGGQDNVQAVAGQMLLFFGEMGFHFPQFPFVAHSRGWTAEDMERNVAEVRSSDDLRRGARALVERSVDQAQRLVGLDSPPPKIERGGRKAHRLADPGG